jgi:dihydroorotase/N-acyl-D-amino-acid deacylase
MLESDAMILLHDALLYDGEGREPECGDLLLDGDRIAAVGIFSAPPSAHIVPLHGLAVAPGFIDLHSHSDAKLLDGDTAKTLQGVTTELVGNCGFSAFPDCGCPREVGAYNEGILCDERTYAGAAEFLREARGSLALAHVESLVGHGTLRTAALRRNPALAGEALTAELCSMLDEALAEGAAGFSSGLMYAPGATAPLEELEALCKVVARRGKLYATHMRTYAAQLVEAVDEQIGLARRSGCRLQISHLQAVGPANWHRQRAALERIEMAHAEGMEIAFDAYPYLAGSTVLSQLLPQSVWVDGYASYLASVHDAGARSQLAEWVRANTAQRWADIHISAHAPVDNGEDLAGQTVAGYAERQGISPAEAVLELIERTRGQIGIVSFNQSEENLRESLTHPLSSIVSDGLYSHGTPHPRLYGAFAQFLGHCARELGWLTLPEAIRKITSLPADRMGLRDRGRLAVGCRADLVCFDPQQIASPATYDAPRARPIGIHAVYRNGVEIVAGTHPAG